MPYELGTIWNVTSKYIYNTLDKNIGIGTTIPICELDVYCNIAENGIKLEDKYQLKPENNKKYDLIVREDREDREDLDQDDPQLIIWYKFNKDDFTSNFTSNNDNTDTEYRRLIIEGTGTISNLQKEYYVGTGSAEINNELYYKIEMSANQFTVEKCTFCFWLFLNEECENDRYILKLQDIDGAIFYFKYTTDKLIIYKNATNYIEYDRSLDKNKWYHITIIINDTASALQKQETLLINGISINSNLIGTISTVLRGGTTGTADIYLGYTTSSINGYIDDFRIYTTNLSIEYIQNDIIGKITKITPGNISANGNYGIDIVNYSSNVNIGGTNDRVDLRIFGDLTIDGELNIAQIAIDNAEYEMLIITSNITVHNDLIVNKTITENQRTLSQKYASISQIDKHTDVIISKMTDKEDVRTLYSIIPEFFQSNLILAYNFDFNINDVDNSVDFFSNNVLQLNTNTALIYSTFSNYNIVPNISKDNHAIDYYGTKYVKGNSSLYCGSNIFNSGDIDYYKLTTLPTNNAFFTSSESYTIAFWIRFNEIDRNQHIFNFGVPVDPATNEKSINISLNSNNYLNINIINENRPLPISNIIDTFEFKKDEWYHIVLILKNGINIDTIPINTDSNLLIQYFTNLEYINSTLPGDDFFNFETTTSRSTIFTYVNGIKLKKYHYDNYSIFGNSPTDFINYFGVLDSSTTTDYLNGYIDDFKMYKTVVPINYINEYIIGDALIIKPGLLSAIGNYGINIKNFENKVNVGDDNNDVDLHIYGLLKIEETKLTISNCDIDVIGDTLTTSNFEILETLDVSNINVSNIEIYDLISGPGFYLGGSSNFINTIEITTLDNSNLISCNITANTITVNNELILENAILSNITIVGINIDETFSISNNNITILRDLTIGDNSCNDHRYDFESLEASRKTKIKNEDDPYDSYSNFNNYNIYHYPTEFPTITPTDDIQIFDKSIIFYGNTNVNDYDIHCKNTYIRNEYCNIKDEINKSYFEGEDRNRTRIKLDVGNIKLQNGFIELKRKDILTTGVPISIVKIEENQISITSNYNTTILNDSLMLSNTDNYCNCLLTNSSFTFSNGNGFTNDETLRINTIEITEELAITKINTGNTNPDTISIDTANQNIIGKIRGYLCSNSIIDITDEIKTTSNITSCNITITDTLHTSNIICEYKIAFEEYGNYNCNTQIYRDHIAVSNLHIYGGITLGQQTGSADNSIEGSFGSLSIKTINTTNNNSNEISIDTFYHDNLGKIRGFLSSNSEIQIDGLIETSSNIIGIDIIASNILYASNIQGIPGDDLCSIIGILEYDSIININCNITTTQDIHCINQFTSNTLFASNIQGILGNDLCSIVAKLENDSIINISGLITTSSNIIANNITINDTLDVSNIINSSTNDYFITSSNSGIFVDKIQTNNMTNAYSIDTFVGDILGKIRAKLADNSQIDISCNIITSANIEADTLFINTISGNSSSKINITSTLQCGIIELDTIDSDFEILRALNVLNERANGSGTYTGVELSNDHIKWYDETEESYIKINNTGLFSKKAGKNNNEEYEIISYNGANDIKIKCDILEVASFDVGDGSKFSFPNIIDYSKFTATNTETNEAYNIPNVYIGDDKTIANINTSLDVLYVDTPFTARLNTGNLLVRDILEISPDSSISSAIKSMKIFTGNINTLSGSREADIITSPFTNFTNQNGDTIISCSLDKNSVGINTQPGISDDDIKLYIEGGIQCSKDIVAFANVSDKRFKTNISSFDINDIDIVNKLNPVRFIWKDNLFNSNMANKPDIGFIAQEVKEVIPEAVSVCKIEMDNIDYNYIKYERIIPYLVNNIKYLNNKIVELENKLNGI